jgi:hypothetical protein
MNLSQLSFGAPAAERDIQRGLVGYFVESETYHRVARGEKTIVLGNRGTGKSAIFKVLAERERESGASVIELRPEDYSYEMLAQMLRSEAQGSWAKHGAFAAAWKYLVLILIMKDLTHSGPRFKRGDAARIYKYLRDNHGDFQGNLAAILISYLKRLEGIKVGNYEASVKTRELARLYKLEELEPLLPALKGILEQRRVLVFVDELDRGWDASEDAQAFVAGIFQAAISLNELSSRLTVYVSLRQELYDSIPVLYEDAQKYRDIIEIIRWNESSLLSVIGRRIRHTLPELEGKSDDVCWSTIFSEILQYRRAKSFNYMVDRTLYRPREIIQFCTDALEESQRAKASQIDYSVISRAELRYSEARTQDIAAEYRFQYPGLLSVFEVFRGRHYLMERSQLEEICLGILTREHPTDLSARWLENQDHDLLIEILWRVGFLRARAVGGLKALRRSGSSYVGPHQVSFLNLRTIQRFQVHPMFRSFLGMKEPKGANLDDAD